MDKWSQFPTVEEVNKIDMVGYLAGLGHHPVSITGNEYRYLSLFRHERFPSFVVFRDSNTWRDGADLRRQQLMDFGIQYHGSTIGEVLNLFARALSRQAENGQMTGLTLPDPRPQVTILEQGNLFSHQLACFLKERRIPWEIAKKHCGQIEYGHAGMIQKAVSFLNDAGGFELENSFFQGHAGPRDKTYLDQGAPICSVFQDFMDFLSYKAIAQNEPQPLTNHLIFNGPRFPESSLPILNQQQKVHLYLPRNDTACSITDQLCRSSDRFRDQSQLYKGHPSLNAWTRYIGLIQRPKEPDRQRLRRSG
jgi:hypothetical protein